MRRPRSMVEGTTGTICVAAALASATTGEPLIQGLPHYLSPSVAAGAMLLGGWNLTTFAYPGKDNIPQEDTP